MVKAAAEPFQPSQPSVVVYRAYLYSADGSWKAKDMMQSESKRDYIHV